MSSDSEDDCYGNIAQKLQSMKNKYSEDKIEMTNLLIADLKEKTDNSWRKNDSMTSEKDCDLSQNSEDFSLDAIIAKNSSRRATRVSKRAADIVPPEKVTRKKRTKKSDETVSKTASNSADSAANSIIAGTGALDPTAPNSTVADTSLDSTNAHETLTRSRGRARGRAGQVTPSRGQGRQPTIPDLINTSNTRARRRSQSRARGRGRSPRARGQRSYWSAEELSDPALFDFAAALASSMAMISGPVYSVGNTDDYPDQCDDQPLFNNVPKPKPTSDVVVVEEELDENEELSVKVYWQSSEHVKFNIRRFQKLSQIFDHFAERENVSRDKLFFTYNDKILKSSDTPDSIGYSIAKFIDGGVINQSVSSIVKNIEDDGIKLKFQCQNVKKPFVLSIDPDDKMSVVMMKCAEHLEKSLDKLKFYFDGDLITGQHTAKELELEGGECIDVRIIS